MMLARPRPMMAGLGQPPQMPFGLPQQMPQQGMQPGMPGGMQMPQQGMPQLPPELLARLQQMQGGLGGYQQPQSPQMGFGRPTMGIQPLSPASAYSFR